MESRFRFLSLNIGMKRNLDGLFAVIDVNKPDIVFLQEVVLSQDELQCQINRVGFLCETNSAEDVSKPGTALLWRSHLQVSNVSNFTIGRAQLALFHNYVLLNIYAPSGSNLKQARNSFFAEDIFRAFCLYPSYSWVFGGDFNSVLHPSDIENGTGFGQK